MSTLYAPTGASLYDGQPKPTFSDPLVVTSLSLNLVFGGMALPVLPGVTLTAVITAFICVSGGALETVTTAQMDPVEGNLSVTSTGVRLRGVMRFARTACLMMPEVPESEAGPAPPELAADFSRWNFDVSFPMTMVSSSCVTVTLARCFPFSSMVLSSTHLYVPLVVWPTSVVFDVPSFANSSVTFSDPTMDHHLPINNSWDLLSVDPFRVQATESRHSAISRIESFFIAPPQRCGEEAERACVCFSACVRIGSRNAHNPRPAAHLLLIELGNLVLVKRPREG